ncbi:putative tail protein [Vibrio phage vB_pir03]|nr:putative tail protein [Vibrio phage vB_pir03]
MAIYPFDQTGRAASNRIINEDQEIISVNGVNLNYLVPHNAPFFGHSLRILDLASSQFLEEGTDYILTHKFQEAEDNLALGVYGSVTFLDPNRTGKFRFAYNTLGGDFVTSITQAIDHGYGVLNDLIHVDWTELTGTDITFPPTHHTQPLTDLDAVADVITIMQQIRDALADPFNSLTLSDVQDLDVQFIVPFISGIGDIAGAIRGLTLQKRLPHEYDHFQGNVVVDLGAMNPGIWVDTGLSIGIVEAGSYVVDWSALEQPIFPITSRHCYRFVVNGGAVDESYVRGAIVALPANATVKLQAMVKDAIVPSFKIAEVGQGAHIKAIRIDN